MARWGGDEFVVLAEWTSGREALILAHRIRETLAHAGRQVGAGGGPTVSIGIAELRPGRRADALLVAADEALHNAKMAGRDRAVLAPATRVTRRKTPSMSRLKTRPLRPPVETPEGER